VAADSVVGPPRRMQWIAGPLWSRHHETMPSVSAMVSSGGRIFYIVDEAPVSMQGESPDQRALVARDAFNGIERWRIPIDDWGWKAWSTFWKERFNQPNQIPRHWLLPVRRTSSIRTIPGQPTKGVAAVCS